MCVEKKGGRPALTPYSPCRRPVECPRTASNSGQHGHKCETYQLSYRCRWCLPPSTAPTLPIPHQNTFNTCTICTKCTIIPSEHPHNALTTPWEFPQTSFTSPSQLPHNSLTTPPELLWTPSAHPQNTPRNSPNYITNPHKSITYISLLNIYKTVW